MLALASIAIGLTFSNHRSSAVSPRSCTVVASSVVPQSLHWSESNHVLRINALRNNRDSTQPSLEIRSHRSTSHDTASSSKAAPKSGSKPEEAPGVVSIEELIVKERLGQGSQSEVLLGELPDSQLVAVKVGLRPRAIDREAIVLGIMSGVPGFPTLLHHEPAATGGGFMVVDLLGPSLADLANEAESERCTHLHAKALAKRLKRTSLHGKRPSAHRIPALSSRARYCDPGQLRRQQRRCFVRRRRRWTAYLDGQTLLQIGSRVLCLLRDLHAAGFVHNDIKPANILLGASGSAHSSQAEIFLIDFGSCTQIEDRHALNEDTPRHHFVDARRPLGTTMFSSLAADDCPRKMRPADDIESLVYTLVCLGTGRLPWEEKPALLAASMKRELLASSHYAKQLMSGLDSTSTTAALQALWAEVRRYHGDSHEGEAAAPVDYDACLAALQSSASELAAEADSFAQVKFSFQSVDRIGDPSTAGEEEPPAPDDEVNVRDFGLVVPTQRASSSSLQARQTADERRGRRGTGIE